MTTEELFSKIESLPVDLKTKLAERILVSINPIQKEIDKLWAKEVETRLKEVESGKKDLITMEDVFKEIFKESW